MDIQKEREVFDAYFKEKYPELYKDVFDEDGDDRAIIGYSFAWSAWQAAKAQAVPEWISVADEMPPVEQTVLVCWDYAPDIEPDKEYTTTDEDLNEYWPNCQDEPPTHWMPLPKVIKAQEPTND